jgi:hypothetical protein
MKKRIYFLLFLISVSLACGRKPDLGNQIQLWINSHNRHNVTEALTFYADDATLSYGIDTIKGKNAYRDLFDYDSVMNDILSMKDFIIHEDTVIVNTITEQWDFGRVGGIIELNYLPGTKITFKNGLIHAIDLCQFVQSDQDSLNLLVSKILDWISVKYPDSTQSFIESNRLINHNTKTAQMHMRLLKEYLVSQTDK